MKRKKINIKYSQLILQIAIIISLTFLCNEKLNAQISFLAGGNYSNVRENISLKNKKPIIGYNLAMSLQYYPFKKNENISIINELQFIQKGYQQDFEKNYTFRFNYFSFPILINYSISKKTSIHAGMEISGLISTNKKKGLETYKNTDFGVTLGTSFFNNKRVNIYSRFTYGLIPMLEYYKIDKLGNFENKIKDLKNISFSVGIKINLYDEKIKLYN